MTAPIDRDHARQDDRSTLIAIKSLTKTYDGDNFAVKGVTFDVVRGEFLTLLGPSGSGKSTLLMMLAGFEAATSGTVLLDEESIGNRPAYARDFGVVFQNYALFPHMTVQQNVAYPLKIRGFSKSQVTEEVGKILDIVRLNGLAGRKPAQLSGGQQQRVALARALVFRPRLVLLDEPLGALDRHLREQMQFELKQIHAQLGLTFVYVTHDQEEALTMSDRIAVMRSGKMEQLDEPKAIYDNPNNEFIASFVGQSNKFRARVSAISEVTELITASGQTVRLRRRPEHVVGSECVVCVRPEALSLETQIGEGAVAANGPNSLSGRVTNVMFVGDHIRTTVLTPEMITLIVKSTRSGPSSSASEVGANVRVTWSKECGSAFLVEKPADGEGMQK